MCSLRRGLRTCGDVQNVAPGCVPRIYHHSYTISADLHIPDGGAEGVIVADANHLGGFSLFVQDGKLKHTYAFLGVFEYHQESDGELPGGDVNVQMSFVADEAKPATPGQVTLYVNGKPAGQRPAGSRRAVRFQRLFGPGQRPGRRPQLRRQGAVRVHRTVKKVVFDVAQHADGKDEDTLHAHAHQAHAARGINA
jgi:hypothetical protein